MRSDSIPEISYRSPKKLDFWPTVFIVTFVLILSIVYGSSKTLNFTFIIGDSDAYFSGSGSIVYEQISIAINWSYILIAIYIGIPGTLFFWKKFDAFVFLFIWLVPITEQIPLLHSAISQLGSIILILFWVTRKLVLGKKIQLYDQPIRVFLIGYTVWLGITTLLSTDFATSSITFFRQSLFFLVFYILMDWMRDWRQIRLAIIAIFLGCAVVTSSILLQAILKIATGNLTATFQVAGIFGNPVVAGMYLSFTLPLYLSFFLHKASIPKRQKRYIFLLISSGLLALFVTGARESMFGMLISIIALITVYRLWRRQFFWTIGMLIGFVSILFAVSMAFNPRIFELLNQILRFDNLLSGRNIIWARTLEIIRDHPFFGAGPETLAVQITKYAERYNQTWEVRGAVWGNHAHNVFLDAAAATGIPGAIMVVWFYARYFRIASRVLRKVKLHTKAEALLYGCVVTMIGYTAQSLFGAQAILGGSVARGLILWLLIAFTLRIPDLEIKNKSMEILNDSEQKNFVAVS